MKNFLILALTLPFLGWSQENFTFNHDGIERDYILYMPDALQEDAPLVFVGHGYSGNAQEMMNSSDMNSLADTEGFAVCYPEGTVDSDGNHFWNVGYNFHQNETVDDVGFLVNLASYLQESYAFSSTHTFATGMSNGGELCYLLACEASATFRAVASVAGGIWYNYLEENPCQPNAPIPVFIKHGTNDNVTYYEGDLNDMYWGPYLSVDSVLNIQLSNLMLNDLAIDTLENINNNQRITIRYKYSSVDTYKEVWLYKYVNGGHNWNSDDYSIEEEIWDFFTQMSEEESKPTSIAENHSDKEVLQIIDVLGRQSTIQKNKLLHYLYKDGTIEKKIILE
jgi:polyhydroxybutyrate depolymerase